MCVRVVCVYVTSTCVNRLHKKYSYYLKRMALLHSYGYIFFCVFILFLFLFLECQNSNKRMTCVYGRCVGIYTACSVFEISSIYLSSFFHFASQIDNSRCSIWKIIIPLRGFIVSFDDVNAHIIFIAS